MICPITSIGLKPAFPLNDLSVSPCFIKSDCHPQIFPALKKKVNEPMNLYCFENCLSQYFLFDKSDSPSHHVFFLHACLVAECYHNGVHQAPAWLSLFGKAKKGAAAETPEQGSSDKRKDKRKNT